jgi:hypothetical protein
MEPDRNRRLEIAAESQRGVGRIGRRSLHQRGGCVPGIDSTAWEDMHVGSERHRRRTAGQQDLGPSSAVAQQNDGRRRERLDSLERHEDPSMVSTNDHSRRPGSSSMSREASRISAEPRGS